MIFCRNRMSAHMSVYHLLPSVFVLVCETIALLVFENQKM